VRGSLAQRSHDRKAPVTPPLILRSGTAPFKTSRHRCFAAMVKSRLPQPGRRFRRQQKAPEIKTLALAGH